MAKVKKSIKGGAPIPQPTQGHPQNAEKLTAEQMLADKWLYKDMMYKPGQVKSPEGMEVNPEYLTQIDILKQFSDIKIQAPVFDAFARHYQHETYEECMEISHDNNLMVLLEALSDATDFSDMENEYDRGFVNIIKMFVALYTGNPYTHDRIGWFMWEIGKHIAPNCYFPLHLEMYYDPRLWHRPGQVARPPLRIPRSVAFDGSNQKYGPEDDIWSCELPD